MSEIQEIEQLANELKSTGLRGDYEIHREHGRYYIIFRGFFTFGGNTLADCIRKARAKIEDMEGGK